MNEQKTFLEWLDEFDKKRVIPWLTRYYPTQYSEEEIKELKSSWKPHALINPAHVPLKFHG